MKQQLIQCFFDHEIVRFIIFEALCRRAQVQGRSAFGVMLHIKALQIKGTSKIGYSAPASEGQASSTGFLHHYIAKIWDFRVALKKLRPKSVRTQEVVPC